jgi:hypothetical protein
MKNNPLLSIFTFVLLAMVFTGCEVIGGIFEAGLWVGVLLVVLVIAIIFWVVKKLFR